MVGHVRRAPYRGLGLPGLQDSPDEDGGDGGVGKADDESEDDLESGQTGELGRGDGDGTVAYDKGRVDCDLPNSTFLRTIN